MKNNFDLLQQKIINRENLEQKIVELKNKKIVFTNGCFDIIHQGHITYLAKAADFGDVFIIGLNSDSSVKKLKGENRPIQDEKSRALILSAFQFVNFVVIFDEETPYNLISKIKPDFLIKGGDYKLEEIVGADIVTEKGGKVITIPFVDGFSSTNIIKSM